MSDNFLTKQVGPLPMGAWVAVVGGGLALAFYANRSQGNGSASDEEVLLAEPGVGVGGGQFIESPPTLVTPEIFETLDIWVNKAITYLIAQGKSPLTASNAIKRYAQGQTLSNEDAELVNLAIKGAGLPPAGELTEPIGVTPAPTPSSGTYAITAKIPSTRKAGKSIAISGRVTRGGGSAGNVIVKVYIKRAPASSHSWVWRKNVATFSDGSFRFSLAFPTRHSYHVQLRGPGGSSTSRYVQTT